MDEQGWTTTLGQAGVAPFFDRAGYQQYLFSDEVAAITRSIGSAEVDIEVFRRTPPGA